MIRNLKLWCWLQKLSRQRLVLAQLRSDALRPGRWKKQREQQKLLHLLRSKLSSESHSDGNNGSDVVTLSPEEYLTLFSKARGADEIYRKKEEDALLQVETASNSESESVTKLEDAKIEVEECKKALREALQRVEAANHEKLAVQEILRRWKSENGHRKQPIGGLPKFKVAAHHRRGSQTMDIAADVADGSFKPTLSIGQILSMKLMGPDGYDKSVWDDKVSETPIISLGQILNRSGVLCREDVAARKRISGKRKKFALNGLSVLLAKQSKCKKSVVFVVCYCPTSRSSTSS